MPTLGIFSLDLSGDGSKFLVCRGNNVADKPSGSFQVFSINNGAIEPFGQGMTSQTIEEQLGSGGAISSNGRLISIGRGFRFSNRKLNLHELVKDEWVPIGDTLYERPYFRTSWYTQKFDNSGGKFVTIINQRSQGSNAFQVYDVTTQGLQFAFKVESPFLYSELTSEADFSDNAQKVVLSSFPSQNEDRVYIYSYNGNDLVKTQCIISKDCDQLSRNAQISITDDGQDVVIFRCNNTLARYTDYEVEDYILEAEQQVFPHIEGFLPICSLAMSDDGRHIILFDKCTTDNATEIHSFFYDKNTKSFINIASNYLENVDENNNIKRVSISDDGATVIVGTSIIQDQIFNDPHESVQVFNFDKALKSFDIEEFVNLKITPNPTLGRFIILTNVH